MKIIFILHHICLIASFVISDFIVAVTKPLLKIPITNTNFTAPKLKIHTFPWFELLFLSDCYLRNKGNFRTLNATRYFSDHLETCSVREHLRGI